MKYDYEFRNYGFKRVHIPEAVIEDVMEVYDAWDDEYLGEIPAYDFSSDPEIFEEILEEWGF